VNLGSTKYAKLYATQHFTTSSGQSVTGAPIEYTVTIPSTVKNEAGAEEFVRFILSARIRAIAAAHGLLPLKTKVGGDRAAVPGNLTGLIGKR
jgi:ABC-type molybdate transport system substrate-binding protein